MGKKRSSVWNHFVPDDTKLKAHCRYCTQTVSILGGSISNLSRHLKKKHSKLSLEKLLSGEIVSFSDPQEQYEEEQSQVDRASSDLTSLITGIPSGGINVGDKTDGEVTSKTSKLGSQVLCIKRPVGSRKNKSDVWDHFTKYQSPDSQRRIGKCHYCPKIVSASGGSSNLKRHLLRKHPDISAGLVESNASHLQEKPNFLELTESHDVKSHEDPESHEQIVSREDPLSVEQIESHEDPLSHEDPQCHEEIVSHEEIASHEDPQSHEQGESHAVGLGAPGPVLMTVSVPTKVVDEPNTFTVNVVSKPATSFRRGLAWAHFAPNESNTKAKCHHCGTLISICYGSLGNLFRHLRKKHPKVHLPKLVPFKSKSLRKESKAELIPVLTRLEDGSEAAQLVSKSQTKTVGPGKKVSDVWKHFTKLRNSDNTRIRGECHYCKKLVSASSGSISNLRRHLTKKHPKCEESPSQNQSKLRSSSFISSRLLAKAHPAVKEEFEITVCDSYLPQSSSSSNPLILKLSSPGQSFADNGKSLSADKKKYLDKQLAKFICKGFYPPSSFLEGEGFKELIQALNPAYEIISLKDFKNSFLPKIFEETVHEVQTSLNAATMICLSAEAWTTSKEKCFATLTAHYLVSGVESQDLQPHASILSCSEFIDSYAPENVAVWFQSTVIEWNLENKIAGIVIDDSMELRVAAEFCNWHRIPCFANALNSIVVRGLKEMEYVIVKVRRASEHIRSSPQITNNFYEIQKQIGLPKFKLKEDNPSIWRTTWQMMERFLMNKDCIIPTLAQSNYSEDEIQYLNSAWEIIDAVVKILNLFDEVVADLSIEKSVVLSTIPILSRILVARLNSLVGFPNEVEIMRSVILEEFNVKFNVVELEKDPLIGLTVLLDPRFKKEGFACEDHFSHIKSAVVNELQSLPLALPDGSQKALAPAPAPAPAPAQSSSLWAEFDKLIKQTTDECSSSSGYVAELENYLSESLIPRTSNPLVWWNNRKTVYPSLYLLMLKRLCTPASAVPFKRLFSKEGFLLTDRRFNLNSSKLVPMIAFLQQNL